MTPRLDDKYPFVLLDDARGGKGVARLYRKPVEVIEAWEPEQVPDALAAIETAVAAGRHAAGYIGYEAGFALESKLTPLAREAGAAPLVWFGLFERFHRTDARSIPAKLPDPAGAWLGAPKPLIDETVYRLRIANIQAYIEAGDIYQANFTFRAEVATQGFPLALYARLRAASRAGYGGVVFTGERWLLSLSPEMFFTSIGGRLTARPMKGTAARLDDPAGDAAAARNLAEDTKQRAENLMIVDLLRNDLSRVAEPGSVAVPSLFRVETFPTIHQMTSTVTATLAPGHSAIDVIRAIFPCGSITGAPKLRAMEVIDELEERPRGAYTGSIGWLTPGGDAAFNVAIRTLAMTNGEDGASLGLGSGIVADSEAGEEWRECLAKSAFVTAGARRFDLFETMRFDPDEGIVELERHLSRMGTSAAALEFAFNRHAARNELQAATFRLREPSRVRLMLSRRGGFAIEARALEPAPEEPVAVAAVKRPVAAHDFRLRHKTTDCAFYRAARAAGGTWEVVLVDDKGYVTEGSFTNIFVERRGKLLTPPLARGLLPGTLRARLIEEGRCVERDLRIKDLGDGFLIGNGVRGFVGAILA